MKTCSELLHDIDTAGGNVLHTAALREKWKAFQRALDPEEDEVRFAALREEFAVDPQQWIENHFEMWVTKESSHVRREFTRLAAIRTLAAIAGPDPDFGPLVFAKLWSVVDDSAYTVDARAWALYGLELCNVEVDAERWRHTFGREPVAAEGNESGFYWLESVAEAKVRQRAVQAIGQMVKHSERAACWDRSRREACAGRLTRCRLQNDDRLFEAVERMLLVHWDREIHYSVTASLVEAWGNTAGWAGLPDDEQKSWKVVDVLTAASRSPNSETRDRVPEAIEQIAAHVIRRPDILPAQRALVLRQLRDLAVARVKKLALTAKHDGVERGYEQQRRYLKALRAIAGIAVDDAQPPESNDIISMAVAGLLAIAAGFPGAETEAKARDSFRRALDLRQLALLYLRNVAEADEAVRQIVAATSVERCKLLLADPQRQLAHDAAEILVLLIGEEAAARHFLNIILADEGLSEAIQHRRENWPQREGDDDEYLRRRVRTLAAGVLGSINKNDEAHDELVRTLRSDSLLSSRARDALIVMGGERAVESIVEHNLQQQVNDKFFRPMEEARQSGYQLLEDVRNWTSGNYRIAYYTALATFMVGIATFVVGVIALLTDRADLVTPGYLASGSLVTIAGFVGTYLWEPVKGMNRVGSELSRLVMSFENYLGRMRLIGLGFAHAYTQNSFDQIQFLQRVSDITAAAARESALMMENIGDFPQFHSSRGLVAVPALVGEPLDDARHLAREAGLSLRVGEARYSGDDVSQTVLAQEPPPGIYVSPNSEIRVTPSTVEPPTVEVPDFSGAKPLEALALARERELVVDRLELACDPQCVEGRICRQSLRPGLNVRAGTALTLAIAKQALPPNAA
ncbi:MAG: PASTA domain-containing protein [Candidatus Promineifilaceae bacterium]|nr:PASTA domain-containing protein [Candidatus Promineifilaceae bacterium]